MATARSPGPAVKTIDREVSGPVPDAGGTGSGTGATVKSVGFTASPSSVFNATGAPITRAGTIQLALDNQAANTVLAGPASGGAAEPSFRQLSAAEILADRLGASTYSTLQHFVNTMHSPGLISGGEITVLSATQVRVAAGTGMVRVADDNVSSLPFINWAQTDFTIPADDAVRFFGVVYNAGTPIVEMRTAESWDKDTEFALGTALHLSSNGILVLTNPFKTGDPITNIIQRFDANAPVLRDSYVGGLIISNVGTRNIAISAGTLWHRLNDNPFAAFDSSGASRFTTVYFNGTAWVFTPGVAQWPNAQYNNVATGLASITGARYVNLWFYIGATGGNVFMVYGQAQHVLLADAFDEPEPSFFPPGTRPFVVLAGKLTFQNGGSTPTELLSPFTAQSLGFGSVNTHNDLSGLQGGAAGEYYHLTSARHTQLAAMADVANAAGALTNDGAGNFSYSAAGGSGRTRLSADRTYYVRTDGSDSNTGLVDSSGGAFLTIQKAINVLARDIDMVNFQVTIQVGSGTFNEAVELKSYVGENAPIFRGNTGSPSSVVINGGSSNALSLLQPVRWTVEGFSLQSTANAVNVTSGVLFLGAMQYTSGATNHISVTDDGVVSLTANYSITGGASLFHILAYRGGLINGASRTVTLTGTPGFNSFVFAALVGCIDLTGFTFSGSATGARYTANRNGVIHTNGGGANYFPGNSAGSTATGGQYA